MPVGTGFKKPATAAKPAPGRKSRYAGVKAAQPRPPMPHAFAGTYRFRIEGCEEGHNPGKGTQSYKVTLAIVAMADREGNELANNTFHNVGDTVNAIFMLTTAAGLSRVKAFVIAGSGFSEEEAFDAFDPEGEFIDATVGAKNDFSEKGLTIVGRLVDCVVTRGNATPEGDYYREYAWGVVPDAEQESVLSIENQLAA